MRIVVITQGNLELIDNLLKSNNQVVGIVQAAPRIRRSNLLKYLVKIISFTRDRLTNQPKTIVSYANNKGIPYYYLDKGETIKAEDWFKIIDPDLIVVNSMSHLLKENIINIPKYGAINFHHSYLPDYRGPNPVFWMYYDYVLNPGITIHFIDKAEDHGDIIHQERVAIDVGESLKSFLKKSNQLGYILLNKAIDDINKGKVISIKQPASSPTIRARNIEPKEYTNIINWEEWDVRRIWHFLRGTPKYTTQLVDCNDIIRRGYSVELESFSICKDFNHRYGQIIINDDGTYISCKDGKINIILDFSLIRLIRNNIINYLTP